MFNHGKGVGMPLPVVFLPRNRPGFYIAKGDGDLPIKDEGNFKQTTPLF
jgi:hypothetical protein